MATLVAGLHPVTELNEKSCVIIKYDNISGLIKLDRIVLAPEVGTPELRNTEETQGSQECLQKVRKIHTKKGIVPQNDTTNTPGVITRDITAKPDSTEDGAHYTIHKIVDHEQKEQGRTLYRIKLYSFGEDDDKREPIDNLPHGKVFQYHNSKRLKQLHEFSNARVV